MEYFIPLAGPFPNMLDQSGGPPAVRSPAPRSKGGRSISDPDMPTFSVRGKRFYLSRTMDAWRAVRLFGAPLPLTAFAQRWCGEPTYRHPVYRYPTRHAYTSCLRHSDVTPPMPAPSSLGPPRGPAFVPARHRVLPTWPTPQHPRHPSPGPRHDVMLTSSAEKRQIHTFAKFTVLNG